MGRMRYHNANKTEHESEKANAQTNHLSDREGRFARSQWLHWAVKDRAPANASFHNWNQIFHDAVVPSEV